MTSSKKSAAQFVLELWKIDLSKTYILHNYSAFKVLFSIRAKGASVFVVFFPFFIFSWLYGRNYSSDVIHFLISTPRKKIGKKEKFHWNVWKLFCVSHFLKFLAHFVIKITIFLIDLKSIKWQNYWHTTECKFIYNL